MGDKKINSRMEIKRVGIVGCGMMGSNWSQICAQNGYQVLVSDLNDELSQRILRRG